MKSLITLLNAVIVFFLAGVSGLSAENSGWSFALAGGAGSRTVQGDPNLTPFFMTSLLPPSSTSQQNLLSLAQIEGLNGQEIETKESHYRFMIEKQFGESKNFGLNFGLSGVSATEKCASNCGDFLRLYILNELTTSSGSNSTFALSFLSSSLLSSSSFSYNYYTLDLGFNWHFIPEGAFDPYVGIEAGIGICSVEGASSCTAVRGMGKIGVRYYFTPSVYAFTQAEYQSVTFTLAAEGGGGATIEPADNQVILVGLGYYL